VNNGIFFFTSVAEMDMVKAYFTTDSFKRSFLVAFVFHGILVKKELPEPEIKAYVIEEDKWVNLDQWPIKPAKEQRYYLTAEKKGSKANVFNFSAKKARRKKVGYTYDPNDPIIVTGGETIFTSSGRRGCNLQPEAGWRDDVLSFVSEPLTKDMAIAGAIKVMLTLKTDVDDTAFAFTISEVTPKGEAYNIRTSITTLGYRNDLLGERQTYKPGKKVKVEIVALPIVWNVKAGNSLRIDIKSSNFPEYAVHSNTAGVWAEQAETKIAHQTIFVGGNKRSYVTIPLIEME